MTTKDDFKQQIKAGNIRDALTLSLGEAVELEITTWVSSSSPASHSSAELDQPKSDSQMRTRMNIIDGEINNEVGSEFMGNGPYTELKQFHLQQVQQGRQTIQQNLENLQQLFSVLSTTMGRLSQGSELGTDSSSSLSAKKGNRE